MLETVAMVLFALWVLGLITGNSLAGAIHVLLVAGLIAAYLHHRAESRAREDALMRSSRAMANAMRTGALPRRPAAPTKTGNASRPTAAA